MGDRMRVLLDACVLYPTVMREVLLGVAAEGLMTPLWSARIVEEWARAARKLGPAGETLARGDIALVRAAWPAAEVVADPDLEATLWLPDPNDVHVLASAIKGDAGALMTVNSRDFPRQVLAEHGIERGDPDTTLVGFYALQPEAVSRAVARVHAQAEALSGAPKPLRQLLKKARLPRLGKALSSA